MHTVFFISRKIGKWKRFHADELVKRGYKKLKSYATRPRRVNEGDTHIFY